MARSESQPVSYSHYDEFVCIFRHLFGGDTNSPFSPAVRGEKRDGIPQIETLGLVVPRFMNFSKNAKLSPFCALFSIASNLKSAFL